MYKLLIALCAISWDNIVYTGFATQDFYWRDYSHGIIPDDAFEAKPGIYVGQAYYHGGGLLPAAIYPSRNYVVAVYAFKANVKENIKILCIRNSKRLYWEAINFTNSDEGDLVNAVKGGYQDNENLYIGVVKHDGEWKLGKVKLSDPTDGRGLFIWTSDGKYLWIADCYLLKYNHNLPIDQSFNIRSL